MKELLMGCGHRVQKDLFVKGYEEFDDVVRVDLFATHSPDLIVDLAHLPLPFKDNTFDEIHAYEILEHLAQQGDYRHFFAEFNEYHRILKPGGRLFASTPWWQGEWAWGDPGHTRVIQPETLSFLNPDHYKQIGETKSSDYRPLIEGYWKADFMDVMENNLRFVLRALVPGDETNNVELPAEPADEEPVAEPAE